MTILTLSIGNTAKPLDNERWEWHMFVGCPLVDGSSAASAGVMVDAVSMKLHRTFANRYHDLKKSSNDNTFHSIHFIGWGTFEVKVKIQLLVGGRKKEVHTFGHMLEFHNGGSQRTIEINILTDLAAPTAAPLPSALKKIRETLSKQPYLKPSDDRFWHGRLLISSTNMHLQQPKVTWKSSQKPRDDHDAPDWLTASEFEDYPNEFQIKIDCLVQLLQQSTKTVVYSGAGISVAAGIQQAARSNTTTSGGGGGGRRSLSTTAQPTITHYALAALAKNGFIHGWVQQNHDGLPQKAGYPQEYINEIHGSWYDPSNPVVIYSGTLRGQEHDWMVNDAETADLVLVLGTSLGGLNSDQVAIKTAHRSKHGGRSLGMVMINLQQTEHDGKASLRIFSQTDQVFSAVLTKLGISLPTSSTLKTTQKRNIDKRQRRFLIPYDQRGHRSNSIKMWWDLCPGSEIQLTPNHDNIAGAMQPVYNHIAEIKHRPAYGEVLRWKDSTQGIDLNIEGVSMTLGQWWIDAALRGGPQVLPIININPEMVGGSHSGGKR